MGFTSQDNLERVLRGESCLARHDGQWSLPQGVVASLFTGDQRQALMVEGLTPFESVTAHSVSSAIAGGKITPNSRVVFILSTTKGNVEQLSQGGEYILPGDSARRIARHVGLDCDSLVVCNACISGLSAIILADRLLRAGMYDYAVVCGVDVQSDFIVSGFQSLQAVSQQECRPFDIERIGLNLGEAAATVLLAANEGPGWKIVASAMSNDAYHISAPSKQGYGLQLVLQRLMDGRNADDLALINAHGTATLFNDQMEGIALREQGLTSVPVNGLKGYFGHTMGAAGVLETIITMHAVERGYVPGTRGFEELGVSGRLDISPDARPTSKRQFVKLLSGFGGCNAGIVCSLDEPQCDTTVGQCQVLHSVTISPSTVEVDGKAVEVEGEGVAMLTALYKTHVGDYPKFYKMDRLSRLGFIASELLLQVDESPRFVDRTDRGVILFDRHSTTHTDRLYYDTIHLDEYFPSPSLFVYTLPNILTGEISIRNHYHGETCHYLLDGHDEAIMQRVLQASMAGSKMASAIAGWVDYEDDCHFEAKLSIIEYK